MINKIKCFVYTHVGLRVEKETSNPVHPYEKKSRNEHGLFFLDRCTVPKPCNYPGTCVCQPLRSLICTVEQTADRLLEAHMWFIMHDDAHFIRAPAFFYSQAPSFLYGSAIWRSDHLKIATAQHGNSKFLQTIVIKFVTDRLRL